MVQLKEVISTGEVAKLLKVTTMTVARWFDEGLIKGFTHPGSNTRRVVKQEFMKFIEKHDIPLTRLQKEPILTTAQCARFCFVTTNTISKWVDGGFLPGFNLGTERRLVFYKDLVRFMKDTKIPLVRIKEYTPPETGTLKRTRKKSTNGRKKNKGRGKRRKR